jgi:hypothetical protein
MLNWGSLLLTGLIAWLKVMTYPYERLLMAKREPVFVSLVVGKLIGWNLTLKVCDNIN